MASAPRTPHRPRANPAQATSGCRHYHCFVNGGKPKKQRVVNR